MHSVRKVAVIRNTPEQAIDRYNAAINATLAEPKIKARLAELGGTVLAGPPALFGKFVAAEIEKWSKVIRVANIKAD